MRTVQEHLEELSGRLRIVIVSVVLAGLIFFIPRNATPLSILVLNRIKSDLLLPGLQLYSFNFFEGIQAMILVAGAGGILLSLPLISYEFYKFLKPGLRKGELFYLKIVSVLFVLLFCFGAVLSYLLILPLTLKILIELVRISGADLLISITQFILFVLSTLLLTGFLFTFPLYLTAGIRMGLVDSRSLKKNRKFVVVAVLIFTAVITPDPTIVSMLILSLPIILLYEASLMVGAFLNKKD